MRPGLRPGDCFKEFIPGAETAGQGNVSIREFMHTRLASMHVRSDIHLCQTAMCKGGGIH